jgi:hypothetical protein
MKPLLLAMGLLLVLLLAGCCSLEGAVGDLSACMSKCEDVCSLVKGSNMSLDGFNSIGLSKASGGMTVSCNCICP